MGTSQPVLLVQWYAEPSVERRTELVTALEANAASAHLAAVVLLHAWAELGADAAAVLQRTGASVPPRAAEGPALLAAYQGPTAHRATLTANFIEYSQHLRHQTCIAGSRVPGHGGRLRVADAAAYANDQWANRTVIFANTDIAFDDSLRLLLNDRLLHEQRVSWALSRYSKRILASTVGVVFLQLVAHTNAP